MTEEGSREVHTSDGRARERHANVERASGEHASGNGASGGRFPRRVAITGIGPITASGIGKEALWEGLQVGRSPIGPVTRFDAGPFRSRIAAEIHDFEPTDFMERVQARRLDRFAQFAVAATRAALEDSSFPSEETDPARVAVLMGSALGGVALAEQELAKYLANGVRAVNPRLATTVFCGAASCQVAIEFGFTGPNSTNAMSCASGTIAIGEAWRLIRDGTVDAAVAGAMEAPLAALSFGAFAIIRAMSTRNDEPASACRPFDQGRDGFVMGEGASVLVLEELERARARGAFIYAEVLGYGTTNDAHHMTAPLPDASQAASAMRRALSTAELTPADIDYVNAHGSSTLLNDSTETLAIKQALGERAREIPVSATKPYYGHALGASGAIEAAICCLSLSRGWVPPTLNYEVPDPECDLDYVPEAGREAELRTLLTNSFGFGGINACLALARPSA